MNENENIVKVIFLVVIHIQLFIQNNEESFSKLKWKIDSCPSWSEWDFSEMEGYDFLPEFRLKAINITLTIPSENNQEFEGEIIIVNKDDSDDSASLSISISTNKETISTQNIWVVQKIQVIINDIISKIKHQFHSSVLYQFIDIFNLNL